MILFDMDWREEMLIFPAVKRAVSQLAKVTAWGFVAAAALWLLGLALLVVAVMLFPVAELPEEMPVWASAMESALLICGAGCEFLLALLLPCLYLLALWCHQVLVAGRGTAVTRWLLLFLLLFAFLHPVCEGWLLLSGKPLLANQMLLPAVLYTALPCVFALNWFRMAALPLRYRLLLLCFLLALPGNYILMGSLCVLLLPCFSFVPLRRLAAYAPLIVSLPPKDNEGRADEPQG